MFISILEFVINYVIVPIWWVLRPAGAIIGGAFRYIGKFLSFIVAVVVIVFVASYFLPPSIKSYVGSAIQKFESGQLWDTGTPQANQ